MLAAALLALTPGVASGPASAEAPIEGHLVAPPGAQVRTNHQAPLDADGGSFLDGFEDLDIHPEDGAMGLVQRGDEGVLITALRLRDEAEAARAVTAFGLWSPDDTSPDPPFDATYDVLPELVPDTITRRVNLLGFGGGGTLVEVTRATGRDLVIFAQLDLTQSEVAPFTREVVDAHLAAFPAVTPPANAGPRPRTWLLAGSLGLAVAMAAAAAVWFRKRRVRTLPPSAPSQGGRVIW